MPEQKIMSHSTEDSFVKRSDQKSIKYGLGVPIGSRAEDLKQWKKSEQKWKKEIEALKKQNKIIYSIANKTGSCREIKNIRAKD